MHLGLPILVGQLGMIVVGFADNMMVGHYSTAALASASFVNNVFNMVLFCCLGFTYGITPLLGAMFSRGKHQEIGASVRRALKLNLLFSLLVTLVMTVLYFNIEKLGQPDELLPVIRPYYLLYLLGIIPVALTGVMVQWSYAIGNTRMPMWIMLAANALNIIGNYILIYGKYGAPELGLNGAGISTLASRLFALAVIVYIFFKKIHYQSYRQGFFSKMKTLSYKKIWDTSIPVAMQMTFESGSFTVAAIMAGWLGAVPLAAYQIIVITGTIGFGIYYSIGSAVAVKVAYAAGKNDAREMRREAWAGYHILLALMSMSSIVLIVWGKDIMRLFTPDIHVLQLSFTLMFPLILYQIADATQINFANALRGTSHVRPMLWIAFVSYILIGIPATYLLAFTASMGTYGIVLSFSVSLFSAALLFLIYFLRNTKRV